MLYRIATFPARVAAVTLGSLVRLGHRALLEQMVREFHGD